MEQTILNKRKLNSATSTKKPRLGFLGVGWIGQNRMEAIHKSGVADVRAVCDVSEERVKNACGKVGEYTYCESYGQLLSQDLDGIIIATPSAMHAEQVKQALAKGISVFVQKPLARTAEETRELIKLAREKNLLLGVDFSYRNTVALKSIYELVSSGAIGQLYAANLVFHNAYGPDKEWYYQAEKAGGGCLTDLGIHLLDTLFWFNENAACENYKVNLYKKGKILPLNPAEVEDYAQLQMELDNGLSAQIACSWNLPAGTEAVIEMSFYGDKGGVRFNNIKGSFYEFEAWHLHGTSQTKLCGPPDEWSGARAVEWATQLAENKGYDDTNEQYLKVAECLDQFYGRT